MTQGARIIVVEPYMDMEGELGMTREMLRVDNPAGEIRRWDPRPGMVGGDMASLSLYIFIHLFISKYKRKTYMFLCIIYVCMYIYTSI